MIIAGIDYSLTSPAICIHKGSAWNYNNCTFHYLVKSDKFLVKTDDFIGSAYKQYASDAERYNNIGAWSLNILTESKVEKAFIEGYAFNAVGRVFQIAENTGLLKHSMWKLKIPFDIFPPTVIKKFGTGKGNANKEKMYDSFLAETGVDIRKKLNIINLNHWNPLSDLVDSYYIAKLGFMKETENENS